MHFKSELALWVGLVAPRKLLNEIDYPRIPFVICVDINCDLLKEARFRARQHLSSFLSDYSLDQLVKNSTFTSGSLLDVCTVNTLDLFCNPSVEFCPFGPHKLIGVNVNVQKLRLKPCRHLSRFLDRADITAPSYDLQFVDWESGDRVYRRDS